MADAKNWRDLRPTPSSLTGSLWPDGQAPSIEEGEIPPAYRAEHYDVSGEPAGEGTRRRYEEGAGGRRRDLTFPPAPEPLPAPIIDNHTHMDLLDGQVAVTAKDALDTGEALGIAGIVQVGCDLPSSAYAVAAAEADPRVLAAVAVHPNEAPGLKADGSFDDVMAALEEMAQRERVRAIGETGLDRFRTGPEGAAAQEESFREHIRLAKKHDLALQIHDRDAHEDVVRILREEGAPERTVFHCYSGDEDLARICNAEGWHLSFAGTVTFKNSKGIQRSLAVARPELILAETDAPFLTPHPFRGRPNASYLTNRTVRFMAELREADLGGLCEQIMENSVRVYGPWS